MKKSIIIILMILGINDLFGKKLFYQYMYVLFKDGKKIEVAINDSTYNLYEGNVSPKGTYVSGFLIKDTLKKSLDEKRKKSNWTLADYYGSLKGIEIFVMYSCVDNRLILYGDTAEYNPEAIMFSEDEKYALLFSYFNNSKLVDLEKGKIEYEFIKGCRDFKWINNELYFLFDTLRNNAYIFYHYNKSEREIEEIYSISREKTYKEFNDYNFEIIDSSRVLFRCKTEDGTWLKLIENERILTLVGFNSLYIEYVYKDNILFSITRVYDGMPDLYLLNLKNINVKPVFTFKDITTALPNLTFLEYSSLFQIGDDIYFLSTIGGPPDFNNVIKYNIPTKKFSLVTKKGYISAPIGYYED